MIAPGFMSAKLSETLGSENMLKIKIILFQYNFAIQKHK